LLNGYRILRQLHAEKQKRNILDCPKPWRVPCSTAHGRKYAPLCQQCEIGNGTLSPTI
jgi:hypothetical protein